MKKKFLSVVLFGVLVASSTVCLTSCKDYDDDISGLQGQIEANQTAINDLKAKIESGEWVSGVTSTANGIVVRLGNGKEYTIVNGAGGTAGTPGTPGAPGADGLTPKIVVMDGYIQVSRDNGQTYEKLLAIADLKGSDGTSGKDGTCPTFSVGADGHLYVQYGEDTATRKDLGITISGIYYVENGITVEIYMPKKVGEVISYDKLVFPRVAMITDIKTVMIDPATQRIITNYIYYYVNFSYGKNTQGKAVTFNGQTYADGAFVSSATSKIYTKINPAVESANIDLYQFYLTDSKGNAPIKISSVKSYMSVNPITRAAAGSEPTANKGLYEMTLGFMPGVSVADLTSLNPRTAYAIATKDVYGNEILSNYDLVANIGAAMSTSLTIKANNQQEVGKAVDLSSYFDVSDNVMDYYFEIPVDQTANKNATGATLNGQMLTATNPGNLNVVVHYLKYNCSTAQANIAIQFVPADTQGDLENISWVIGSSKKTVEFDATFLAPYQPNISPVITYANSSDATKYGPVEGITFGGFTQYNDPMGYPKWKGTFTFNDNLVAPTSYIATFDFAGNGSTLPRKVVKANITVSFSSTFDLRDYRKLAFFKGDEAKAYGTISGNQISYDLFELFNFTPEQKANIEFEVEQPKPYVKDGTTYVAHPWLPSGGSQIVVDKAGIPGVFGGVGDARKVTIHYVPFGNKDIDPISYVFDLTVTSPIYAGVFKAYADQSIKGQETLTLKPADFELTDVYGNKVLATDAKVVKETVVLDDNNAKLYLQINGNADLKTGDVVIGKSANATAIVTPPVCTVRVDLTDQWGMVKSTTFRLTVKQ